MPEGGGAGAMPRLEREGWGPGKGLCGSPGWEAMQCAGSTVATAGAEERTTKREGGEGKRDSRGKVGERPGWNAPRELATAYHRPLLKTPLFESQSIRQSILHAPSVVVNHFWEGKNPSYIMA